MPRRGRQFSRLRSAGRGTTDRRPAARIRAAYNGSCEGDRSDPDHLAALGAAHAKSNFPSGRRRCSRRRFFRLHISNSRLASAPSIFGKTHRNASTQRYSGASSERQVEEESSTIATAGAPINESHPNTSQKSTTARPEAPASDSPEQSVRKAETESRPESRLETPKRGPISVQEVATGWDNSRLMGDTFGLGAIPLGRPRQSALRPAPLPLNEPIFSMNEPNADVEFVVRRRTERRRDSTEIDSFEPVRRNPEADVSTTSAVLQRAAPSPLVSAMIVETRWYTVAPEHFEQFKKDLTAETLIESETATAKQAKESAKKSDRPLAVKVMILPANDR